MQKGNVILLGIVIMLLAIGGGILYWYYSMSQQPPIDAPEIVNQEDQNTTPTYGTLPELGKTEVITEEAVDTGISPTDAQLLTTVYYFVERFGTYSNVADFQNIEDIKSVMTPDLYASILQNKQELTFAEKTAKAYEAYDATVANVIWEEQTDESARARVMTRRHYITEGSDEAFEQEIIVRLTRQNNKWLVSEAAWVARQ